MLVFSGKYSCCRRLLRATWSTRRSNQRIIKEIIPEYSLEALMMKLKLQRHDVDRIRSRVGKIKAGCGWAQRQKWVNLGQDLYEESPGKPTWVDLGESVAWVQGETTLLFIFSTSLSISPKSQGSSVMFTTHRLRGTISNSRC